MMKGDMLFLLWAFVALLVVSALFVLQPSLDITISAWFFDAASGQFPYTYDPVLRFIQKSVSAMSDGLVVFLAACIVVPCLPVRLRRWLVFSRAQAGYLLTSLALGPGLLVHVIIKEVFGRARPDHTDVFGGTDPFTAAFELSPAGGKSFVSGHAAFAFYLLTLVVCLPPAWRKPAYAVLSILCALIASGRVIQGRHFASDVLIGGLLALVVGLALRVVWKRRWPGSLA